jgi:hypothetical protein
MVMQTAGARQGSSHKFRNGNPGRPTDDELRRRDDARRRRNDGERAAQRKAERIRRLPCVMAWKILSWAQQIYPAGFGGVADPKTGICPSLAHFNPAVRKAARIAAHLFALGSPRRGQRYFLRWCDHIVGMPEDLDIEIWRKAAAKPCRYKVDTVGRQLGITEEQRTKFKLSPLGSVDMTREERAAASKQWKNEKTRERQARKRHRDGATPRPQSKSATQPWKLVGMERTQWYEKGQPAPGSRTDSSRLIPSETYSVRDESVRHVPHSETLADRAQPGEWPLEGPSEPVLPTPISGSTSVGLAGLPVAPSSVVIKFPFAPISLPGGRLAVLSGINRVDGNEAHFIRLATNEAEEPASAGMTRKERRASRR